MEKKITYLYKDKSFPSKDRVKDLLSHMTIEEKIAQMQCVWREKSSVLLDENGDFDEKLALSNFKSGNGLGQVGRVSDSGNGKTAREMAELTNVIQLFFLKNTRLGIPVLFHEECLHGLAAIDATSFPQPIGLASTFNPDLVKRIYEVTALEARSRGAHQALTPVLDVAREPRWGRVEETFGEDPYLVSRLGMAAVEGFQGERDFAKKSNMIATLKHFAAHGQPESGTNCAPVNVSERILREVFLYPFKKAVQQSKAISVMAAYNEIDGVPCHASEWLLRNILRNEWGFEGYVVSDYYAIRELNERPDLYGHHLAEDGKGAAVLAAIAGVNIELPEPDCYLHLKQAIDEGLIDENLIDELVSPLLYYKFEMGLFDDPLVDPDKAEKISGNEEHSKLALIAARQTITMLKNNSKRPPLADKNIKKIAVIGPNANRELLGGYSGYPKKVVTLREGIEARAGNDIEVLYHEGCKITIGGSWWEDVITPNNPEEDRKSIAEAVKIARQADAVVLALGGNEQTSREAWDAVHMGDRTNIELVGLQNELVNAIAETGKPITAVLFNGRPLSVKNLAEKSDTLFECWYLGQEAGTAVAGVLFGDYNPGGKLPISIPQSVGHSPCYYNYKPSGRRGYLFDSVEPLFSFGYGLSYTNFKFSNVQLENQIIKTTDSTTVSVDVENTGERQGDEVIQLYIRDKVSSVTRPVKELKGFKRITLKPQEKRTISFEITPEHLAFYDIRMENKVEPGEFILMLGSSSRSEDLQQVVLTVK
jgi:beta-glucosidase